MCAETKIEGLIYTTKPQMKGEVKLECVSLKCVCVCEAWSHS